MSCILVIDDETELKELLSIFLKMKGFDVLEATSGNEGLELMTKNKVDLILTDYHMPNGDGLYLLEVLKKQNCEIPVILCSGGSHTEHQEFIQKGAVEVLEKPINMAKLVDVIKSHLKP